MMVAATKSFEYQMVRIGDLSVRTAADPRSGQPVVNDVIVNDEPIKPTDRFWISLFSRFRINQSTFRYFAHEEVFRRISAVEARDHVRLCIERSQNADDSRLLAVSNPARPIMRHDALTETLRRYDAQDATYADGVVHSTHLPRLGAEALQIGGDDFVNRFVLATPIDGYGSPSIYLSLLRQICTNGMIGYAPAFRSTITLGRDDDNVTFSLARALEGFSNEEGYAALRQRFEAATTSWASVYESQSLYRLLVRLLARRSIGRRTTASPASRGLLSSLLEADPSHFEATTGGDGACATSQTISAFHRMTGDVSQIYGLANPDALSAKRQRTLPVNCRVYDLFNFASEVATHHADPSGARTLQGWLGSMVSSEYDLENSRDAFSDFRDFFLDAKLNGEVAMDLQRVQA